MCINKIGCFLNILLLQIGQWTFFFGLPTAYLWIRMNVFLHFARARRTMNLEPRLMNALHFGMMTLFSTLVSFCTVLETHGMILSPLNIFYPIAILSYSYSHAVFANSRLCALSSSDAASLMWWYFPLWFFFLPIDIYVDFQTRKIS